LVMEYVGGIEIDDIVTLDKEGYARSEICEKLAYNYVNQIIDVGFFHADPHAGNLRIDEGKIVWIDFGMMGELTPRDRDLMKQGVRSLVNRDSALLVETILTLGTSKKEIDHAKFTVEMDRFMNKYINMSLSDINLPQMVQEMFAICHQYAIMLPKGISMLARSLITIEGTMRVLDPKTNIMQVLSSYEMELLNINWNRKLKSMLVKAVEAGEDSIELPIHAKHLMEALQKGQLKVNLNLLGSEVPLANLDRMINRIVVCILIASLLLGSSVICTTNMHPKLLGIPLLGVFGFLIAFGMSLWLFVKMLFLHQKNKPF
ncbi:AarF/UbiB family protein, partial [uncultured Dubosiella sp.]|uniref:AarF/UbiB family protein n=1 Tax=uncultured Dubosiella sp. TaxID=1937011 RepID=UPI00266FEE64